MKIFVGIGARLEDYSKKINRKKNIAKNTFLCVVGALPQKYCHINNHNFLLLSSFEKF
jgi:hypothetical protein